MNEKSPFCWRSSDFLCMRTYECLWVRICTDRWTTRCEMWRLPRSSVHLILTHLEVKRGERGEDRAHLSDSLSTPLKVYAQG